MSEGLIVLFYPSAWKFPDGFSLIDCHPEPFVSEAIDMQLLQCSCGNTAPCVLRGELQCPVRS